MRHLGILLTLLALISTASAAEFNATISVSGEGRMAADPDMATLSLGVVTDAGSARKAIDDNSAQLAMVLSQLKEAGIADPDVQTSGLSLGPRYDYNRADGVAKLTGYAASNMITVRVRALGDLGDVIDGVVVTGANTLNGLVFGLQDPAPATDEARRRAVADARHRAELYAEAAGVKLGSVLSISEQGGMQPPGPMMMAEASYAKGGSVPVASGELVIATSVTVVYQLVQ